MPGDARGRRECGVRRAVEPRLVAEPAEPEDPAPAFGPVEPDGHVVQLCGCVQNAGPDGGQGGYRGADADLAGLVAGGLGALRAVLHPDGVAFGGHLSHGGWPGRGRGRVAAVRAIEFVARQRQHRQGPPPVVADQAEIRRETVLGRSDDLCRQRGARGYGAADLWLWRRAGRYLGAGGRHLLGVGNDLAG